MASSAGFASKDHDLRTFHPRFHCISTRRLLLHSSHRSLSRWPIIPKVRSNPFRLACVSTPNLKGHELSLSCPVSIEVPRVFETSFFECRSITVLVHYRLQSRLALVDGPTFFKQAHTWPIRLKHNKTETIQGFHLLWLSFLSLSSRCFRAKSSFARHYSRTTGWLNRRLLRCFNSPLLGLLDHPIG